MSSNELPLVSVVITTYNRADVVSDAIDSALGQDYPNLEVIVVDDGSSDGTPELLATYGNRIITIRQRNAGYGAARNAGARVARGKYVAWLDSDDLFLPQKTRLQVMLLERDHEVVLISTDFEGFGPDGPRQDSVRSYYSAFRDAPSGAEGIYAESTVLEAPASQGDGRVQSFRVLSGHVLPSLLYGSFVHPPTVMLRRDAVLQAGDLDETLRNSIEYDFFFRLARLGKFAFIDHQLIRYRFSGEQLSAFMHAESMSLSVLAVVERLPRLHPDVVHASRNVFRRRLAECHLDVAYALAEKDKRRAWFHCTKAFRRAGVNSRMLRVLLRMSLPQTALRRLRRVRRYLGRSEARQTAATFVVAWFL